MGLVGLHRCSGLVLTSRLQDFIINFLKNIFTSVLAPQIAVLYFKQIVQIIVLYFKQQPALGASDFFFHHTLTLYNFVNNMPTVLSFFHVIFSLLLWSSYLLMKNTHLLVH